MKAPGQREEGNTLISRSSSPSYSPLLGLFILKIPNVGSKNHQNLNLNSFLKVLCIVKFGEPPHPNADNNTVYCITKAAAIPPPYFIFRLTAER